MQIIKITQLFTLIFQFTISALIILSPIFFDQTQVDIVQISLYVFISVSIGSFLGGIASDFIGRRWILIISVALMLIGSIVMLYNINIAYMICGLGIGPANNLSFVYIAQRFIHRQIWSVSLLCGWALGQILLGAIFQNLESLKSFFLYFQIIPSAVLFLLTVFTIRQSDTFLQKRIQIKKNFKLLPSSGKQLMLGSLLMFAMQMFYYRTQFTLDKYGISLPLNTIIVGSSQFMANITCAYVIRFIPRKISLQIIFVLLLTCFVLLNLIQIKIFQSIIEGIMRILDCFAMAILGVFIPQLFFAQDRGRGVNFVMSFGVIGGGVAPLLLDKLKQWYYLTIFLIIALIASLGLKQTYKQNKIELLTQGFTSQYNNKSAMISNVNQMG